MNKSYIATAIAIRDLKCYSLNTINDRILLQKKIYLAQEAGVPLGYGYSWYIHGPYSPDLTAVAYQIIPEGDTSIEEMHFKEPYASMLEKVNRLESVIGEENLELSIVQWYELVASIAYWYKRGIVEKKKSISKIRETKPQFSEGQISIGYDAYIDFNKSE